MNSSSAPSISNSFWYCRTRALRGSVRMRTSASSSSGSSGAITGKRPMNSGIMPNSSRSSLVTCASSSPRSLFAVLGVGAEADGLAAQRRAMMLSRPTKVPPQMNRMLVVSTWMYCCSGCLRPPWGGTLLTVPSSILSRACCTPSPETSRVMRDVLAGLGDLVDFVDIDDAALGRLDVEIGGVQQLEEQVLDVLADVAGFGQGGGVADGEGDVEDLGEGAGQQGFAAAGRADQEDVALVDLDVAVAFIAEAEPFVVVVDGDRQDLLGAVLADDVLIELLLDRARGRDVGDGGLG